MQTQIYTGNGWEVSAEHLARVLTLLDEVEAIFLNNNAQPAGQRVDAAHLSNLVTGLDAAIDEAMAQSMGVMFGQLGGNAQALTLNKGYEAVKQAVERLGRAKPSTLAATDREILGEAIKAAKAAAVTLDR